MAKETYARLDEVLRGLGFSTKVVEDEKARVYFENKTGALIALPLLPDNMEVLPRHLLMVRTVLQNYGIAEPTAFAQDLQKAS